MTRFFSSLRVRLLLPVLLAIVSAAGLLLYSALEHRRKDVNEAQEHTLRLARLAASTHEQVIQGARQLLFGLVRLPEVRRGEPAACSAFFAGLLQQYPLYANLGMMRPNGDASCSAVPLTRPVNAADMAWFQRVLRSRGFALGDYQIDRITGMPALVLGAPVLDPAGRVQAVVFAALDLKWFDMLAVETRLPEGSALAVIDRHGTMLTRHPNPEQWVGKRVPDASLLKAMETRGQGMIEGTGADGVERLYAFTPLGRAPDPGVYVKIGIPKAVAFSEANRSLAQRLILLGLVAALTLASSWVDGRLLILRPVARLVRATERLSAGDLTARSGLRAGQGELSQLARAFDDMAETLERDTAERKRAEGALRASREQLRALAARLAETEAAERRRIARELHDQVGQNLTALNLNLNILRDQLPPPVAERLAARLTDSMKLVEETIGHIRGVMADLRPPVLDDYGLMAALRWYGEQFSTRTGVVVSVRGEDSTPRPPQTVESALFRIAQEALTNVGKHARATRAEVGLESDGAVVRLTIAEDGVGFDPTTARVPGRGTGWGLATMRERATGTGGTLRVESAPGRGTRVTVEIGRARRQ